MHARRTRALSVGLMTCALVLTGCSTAVTTAPPAATTPAASLSAPSSEQAATGQSSATTASAGDEVRSRSGSFTVVPPEGWTEATDKAKGVAGVDLVLLSSKKVAAFANNLVVTSAEGDRAALADELAEGRQQLGAAGRVVSTAPDTVVAGSTAVGFTTTFEQQGIKIMARSYGVEHGGRVYLMTLSSSQADATHAQAELDDLLSTWSWT
jgi:hypothetical protein